MTHAVLTDFREGFVIAEITDDESGAKTYLLAFTQKGLVVTSRCFTTEIDALNAIDFARTLVSGVAKPATNTRPTLQEVIDKYRYNLEHCDDGDKGATSEQNGVSQS
ncbi:MAG: hypothetical protein IJU91_04590 [Selenomonadaceae bacterium]|nr:hypothetical protein [Selenomonadaceae bacterium]